MDQNFKTTYFKPDRKGVYAEPDGICFCTDQVNGSDCGVILYDKNNHSQRVPFSEKGKRGSLYGVKIHIPVSECCRYQYYCKEEIILDKYAKVVIGSKTWGSGWDENISGGFFCSDFDWGEDHPLGTPYEDSIIYGLHVRSFTMHKSSGVKNKGTFEGIVAKIPYLKELGVTAVELMPAYEFEECEYSLTAAKEEPKKTINCWGFKEGVYYAPKAAFCAGESPEYSFKEMVRELHKAGIEVLMYFYFPSAFNRADIPDILKYWVVEYHIDGIHLLGENLPVSVITQDALLSGTKILYNEYSYWEERPLYENTGVYKDHFRAEMRRFLKGDEDMTSALLYHQRNNPEDRGTVNYMADYNGFTLYDITAYDKKHNEANGEDNRDGSDYNYSWNCGVEGVSRKKSIQELRSRQIKNALAILLLAQGTPFIFSGDEFGNTRNGNNNVYCQDNETGWVKWNTTVMGKEILEFTRFLIDLRKKHPILHMPVEMQILDSIACGYPDVSYHGEEAWRPDLNPSSRTLGIMYCGKYGKLPDGKEDDFLYIAYNMHWLPHKLALPKLPREMKWCLLQCTDQPEIQPEPDDNGQSAIIKERSIGIFISQGKPKQTKARIARIDRSKQHEGLEAFKNDPPA